MSRSLQVLNGHAGIDAIYPGKGHAIALDSDWKALPDLSGNTTVVRVFSTQDCLIEFPGGIVLLPKEHVEYFAVDAGSLLKVKGSGGGQFYLNEGA